MTKRLLILTMLTGLATVSCSSQQTGQTADPWLKSFSCTTPEDTDAPADVTITAQDAAIMPGDGTTFGAWTYDGDVPGPVLRMAVGETLRVKLVNQSPRTTSLHFHGVRYSAVDDGSPEHPESMVGPGCAHVYTITAVQPGVWPYHGHRDPRTEMAFGLYGAVIVPDPAETPADHEYVVFAGQLGIEGEGGDEEGSESPFFMTLNGRAYGGAEVIELENGRYVVTDQEMADAKVGDRVRWRVVAVSPDDPHTFHLHGHRWCDGAPAGADGTCPDGHPPIDNVSLFPAQGVSLEYVEDDPGDWMYHCHIVDHVNDGMFAMYHVEP